MSADRYRRNTCAAVLTAFAMMTANGSAIAQSPRQPAVDKPLTLIAGMPPGGSVDAYARLVQRHLGRFLSGSPTIIVQDKPGAGSLLAVMAVANSTPADGLVMGTYSSSLVPDAISQPDRFKIDFRRFSFVGNVGEDYRVCYIRSDIGIHNVKDLAARSEVIFGATAAGTSGNLNLAILRDLFKVKVKQVSGYPGSAAKRLAFERGEIDGDCGGVDSIPEEWMRERKINMIVHFLPSLFPGVDKEVPFAGDLLTDPADRQLYDFLIMPGRMVGTLLVSDKITNEKVDELRRAFDAMVTDNAFLADADKLGLPIVPISGADVEREIGKLYATPPEILQRARALLKE
jgi:tripartite-type tricarboxylate transporter receptor subunit TctC